MGPLARDVRDRDRSGRERRPDSRCDGLHRRDGAPLTGQRSESRSLNTRAHRAVVAARGRFEGSWLEDLVTVLKRLDFSNAIVLFGAALLMSVLPLIILLGSLANQRIDDDLSRHLSLNHRGAHILEGLFRKSPTHAAGPIVTGLIVAFAGTIAMVSSLQVVYEGVFEQEHRGWRDLPRFLIWAAVLFAYLIVDGVVDKPLGTAAGSLVRILVSFAGWTVFFWWSMHFLLAGRVPWRELIRPALATALFWLGLALASTIYFSSALISEDRLYGVIGVVFIILTWFIAVGAVIVLGAACGAVWQARRGRDAP